MTVENLAKESSGCLQWEQTFRDGEREFGKEESELFSGHKNVLHDSLVYSLGEGKIPVSASRL